MLDDEKCTQPRKMTLAEMWEENNSDCEQQKPGSVQKGSPDEELTDPEDPLQLAEHQRHQENDTIQGFVQAVDTFRENHRMHRADLTVIRNLKELRTTRTPPMLREDDNRFDAKRDRVIICDGCGREVQQSSRRRRTTFDRITCEIAGSFQDGTWKEIPNALRRRAWEERIIDATWLCHETCKAPMTEGNPEARKARAAAWRLAEERKRAKR